MVSRLFLSEVEFTKGERIYEYPEYATNPTLTVIGKALDGVLKGEKYTALHFNCQAYVNEAISNQRRSPAIENSAFGILIIGALSLMGLAFSKE